MNFRRICRYMSATWSRLVFVAVAATGITLATAIAPSLINLHPGLAIGSERHSPYRPNPPMDEWVWLYCKSIWMDEVRVDPLDIESDNLDQRFKTNGEAPEWMLKQEGDSLQEFPVWSISRHIKEPPHNELGRKAVYWREDAFGLPFRCM